jgi:hypothetical protein
LPTSAGTERGPSGFRDRRIGRVAIFAVVILAAFLVSKSCGKTDPKVDQAEAVAIAKAYVDYTAKCTFVRLVKRGFQSRATWAVSLSRPFDTAKPTGPWRVTVVQIDGDTGQIVDTSTGVQGGIRC